MISYKCSISIADKSEITSEMENILRKACIEASSRSNALRYGRKYEFVKLSDDRSLFELTLFSNDEVIPSRAISAVTRSLIDVDKEGIFKNHWVNKALFITRPLETEETKITALTDVELLKEITDMLFNQTSMTKNNRLLAKETTQKVKDLMIDYLSKKSIT